MDRQSLKKIFGDYNPNRKEITNDQYALRLSKLANDFNKDNDVITDDFLNEPEKVFDYLKEKPKTTSANILYAVIGYLEAKDQDTLAKIYRLKKEMTDEGIKSDYSKKVFLGKQKDNYLPYEQVIRMVDRLDDLCDTPAKVNASHLDEWEKQEMNNVRFLFKLYLRYPKRNEFGTLKFISWMDYKKKAKLGLTENYIVMRTKHKPKLSLSDYKTSKTYGTLTYDVSDKVLKKLINQYYKEKGNGEYVFTLPKTKEPWKKYYVSQMMTKWSNRLTADVRDPPVYDGKGQPIGHKISTTLLYKIIVQEAEKKLQRSLNENDFDDAVVFNELLTDYAKIRGHHKKTQKGIYSKTLSQNPENNPPNS